MSRVHARKPGHCGLQIAMARVSRACVGADRAADKIAIGRGLAPRSLLAQTHMPRGVQQSGERKGQAGHHSVVATSDTLATHAKCRHVISPLTDIRLRRDGGRNRVQRVSTYFQIRARISPLPVAKIPPVGLGATEMTACCQLTARKRPRLLSSWRMRPSSLGTA